METTVIKTNWSIGKLSPIPKDLSETLLVLANLLPLFGSFVLNWQISDLFLIYWAESAIIGLFCFIKIITVFILSPNKINVLVKYLFSFIFFLFHFSGFMFGHLMFIMVLFVFKGNGNGAQISQVLAIAWHTLTMLWLPICTLLLSHATSFWRNFILKKEYVKYYNANKESFMTFLPYGRIIVMHLSLFAVAFVTSASKVLIPLSALLIIIVKIITDLRGHRIEHEKIANINNVHKINTTM